MSFFEGAQNTTILGGTQIAAAPGSTVNYHQGNDQALNRARSELSASAAHTAMHDSAARPDAPRCHRNTRAKYLDKLERWMLGTGEEFDGKRLIWLNGGAGAGKSAIMQSIIERCARHAVILGSFFFFRSDSSRNHGEVLIPTLAYQLARMFPAAMAVLEPVITRDPLVFKASLRTQAYELLVRPILYLIESGIIDSTSPLRRAFFIDGLDECTDPQKQTLVINIVASILCEYHVPIHFLIASRPELAISSAFQKEKDLFGILATSNLDDDHDARSDIRQFIEDSFQDILESHPWRKNIKPTWPGPDIITHLVQKSSGHFIYAATAMKFIACSDEYPVRALEVVIGFTPSRTGNPFADLDSLHMCILKAAKYHDQVLKILRYCFLSGFEGSVTTLCFLHEFSPDDVELFLSDVQSLISLVPNGCGEMVIRPKHASLGDFFAYKDRSEELYITREEYNVSFLERYFQMLDNGPRWPLISSPSLSTWDADAFIRNLAMAISSSKDIDLLQPLISGHCPQDVWNFCVESCADTTASSLNLRNSLIQSVCAYVHSIRDSVVNKANTLYIHQFKMYIQLLLDDLTEIVQRKPQYRIIPALTFSSNQSALAWVPDLIFHYGGRFGLFRGYYWWHFAYLIKTMSRVIHPQSFDAIQHLPHSQTSWGSDLAVFMKLTLQKLAFSSALSTPERLYPNPHHQWLAKTKGFKHISMGSPKLSSPVNFKATFLALMHQGCSHGRSRKISNRKRKCKLLLKAVIFYLHKADCTSEVVKLARRLLPKAALWFPKLMKKVRAKMDAYVRRWEESLDGILEKTQLISINDVD